MNTLIIEVASRDTVNQRFTKAMNGEAQTAHVSFPDVELLLKVFTPKRWEILTYLQKNGPLGLRALARAMKIDAGNLQRDLKPLKEYGVVTDSDAGLMVPYTKVKMELVIDKAA